MNQYLSFFTDTLLVSLAFCSYTYIQSFFLCFIKFLFPRQSRFNKEFARFAATHANTHSLYLVDKNGRVSVNQIQVKSERL